MKISHLNPAKYFFVLVAMLLSIVTKAQDGISAKDSAEIIKAMNDVSARIEAVLKADKTLYAEMSDAIKKISTITDTILFDEALAKYRTKYFTAYGAAVKKAGIDMYKIAEGLKLKFPYITFLVNNDFALEYYKTNKTKSSIDNTLPTSQTTTTTTTSISSFDKSKTEGCVAVSGSKVSFDGLKVHCWAGAAVAGGCMSEGVLTNHTNLPDDPRSIVLIIKYNCRAKGYAVSVGGFSSCNSLGAVRISRINSGTLDVLEGDAVNDYALAPILWYARYDKQKDFSHTIDLSEYKGQRLEIIGDVMSFALAAVVCATRGDGYSKITKADLIITK